MPNTETITVYLLKEHISSPADALKEGVANYGEHVVRAGETEGIVYVAQFDNKAPDWVRLLNPVTTPPVEDYTHSTGALLVLSTVGRWFALTFGHGRHMLDPQSYVRRFGLRVALNAADPTRLRGAQARSFNDYALHTYRQVSRLGSVEALELDVERDLVTSVSGAAVDVSFAKRVEGRDSACLTAELNVSDFASACTRLLRESKRSTYKRHYPWIDRVEEITDNTEIVELELAAAARLGEQSFSEFDLFPPELVPSEIVQFRLFPREGGLVVVEPDISLLRFPLGESTNANAAKAALERYKLIGIDTDGEEVARWSFWECLHHEFRQADHTIVLDGGRWYRIGGRFANDIEQFVENLGPSGLELPCALRGETEGKYNERAASGNRLTLLDRCLIHIDGQSAIEACDLFSSKGHFIHVKHRKGGSSPLSHLFGQALVSAECLVREPEFRTKLREKLDQPLATLIAEPPVAINHPIVLGLITKSATAGHPARGLPFFSKVFLRQVIRRLTVMQFEVYVDEIPTPIP